MRDVHMRPLKKFFTIKKSLRIGGIVLQTLQLSSLYFRGKNLAIFPFFVGFNNNKSDRYLSLLCVCW